MSSDLYKAAAACNLRHAAKAVLKELAWFANDQRQDIFPSVELARKTHQNGCENAVSVTAIHL